MTYHTHLARLQDSFLGGGEGGFYLDALSAITLPHIDWLDIGVGHDGSALLPFIDFLRTSGRTVAITGVDPDATGRPRAQDGVSWTLAATTFERWSAPFNFDFVNADQSLYYLPDLPAELARIAGLVRPGGWFVATCWRGDDCLHRLRQALFPDAPDDLTGEMLTGLVEDTGAFEIVRTQGYDHEVNLEIWRRDDAALNSALHVIARAAPITDQTASVSRLSALLDAMPAIAPRRNLAILARRR